MKIFKTHSHNAILYSNFYHKIYNKISRIPLMKIFKTHSHNANLCSNLIFLYISIIQYTTKTFIIPLMKMFYKTIY